MKLTKIALTTVALIAAGSAVSASNYFSLTPEIDAFDRTVELPVVVSSQAGLVQVLDDEGMIVGSARVNAGANTDVKINFDGAVHRDLTTVLLHGDQRVATGSIEVDRF